LAVAVRIYGINKYDDDDDDDDDDKATEVVSVLMKSTNY
jgi:hypothetical protein